MVNPQFFYGWLIFKSENVFAYLRSFKSAKKLDPKFQIRKSQLAKKTVLANPQIATFAKGEQI